MFHLSKISKTGSVWKIEIDFSWSLIHAIMEGVNHEEVLDYLWR